MSVSTSSIHLKYSRLKNKNKLQKELGNPKFIIEEISRFVKEGDIAASTDLICAYIAHSPNYTSLEEFAESIGTTRQTLYRLFAQENVSMLVFFKAIEKIYEDIHS
jgi:hypothetical protein